MANKNKSVIAGLLVVVLCLLLYFSHFPFLSADADLSMAAGRGPWTDEGHYTCQIRNFINHGHFDIIENDSFLKTPLFSFFLLIPFKIFGTSMETARITVLSFVMLMIMLFSIQKNYKVAGIVLALTTLGLSPIYHHTHLALAEMVSIVMILFAGLLFALFIEKKRLILLFCTYLFLIAAVLLKIQFFYVLFIPSLSLAIHLLIAGKGFFSRELFVSILCLAATGLLMYAFWYLPFKYEWSIIAAQQASIQAPKPVSYLYFKHNFINYFLSKNSFPFTLSFTIALILSVYNIITDKLLHYTKSIVLFCLAWYFMELSKLFMNYLPIRYMLGIYFSMGLMISVVFAHYLTAKNNKMVKAVVVLCILSVLTGNLIKYARAFDDRSFNVSAINKYMVLHTNKNDVVIGSWAPTLTWESKNISFPVDSNAVFHRNMDIIGSLKPQIVVSELDEQDSGQAYKLRGINLDAMSESTGQFKIALWDIKIYWLKSNRMNAEKD